MKIDIDHIKKQNIYPEPSNDFFAKMQENIIAKVKEMEMVKEGKSTPVISINFKWVAAAAVVLIAGITAFIGLDYEKQQPQMAQQSQIIDSVYEPEPVAKSMNNSGEAKVDPESKNKTALAEYYKPASVSNSKPTKDLNKTQNNIKDYSVESYKPEITVDKVLVAFTPDQIGDLERNSEQDIYLDLYN